MNDSNADKNHSFLDTCGIRQLVTWGRRIVDTGIQPQLSLEDREQIRLSNGLAIGSISICISYVIGFCLLTNPIYAVPSALSALLFFVVMILNGKAKYSAALQLYLFTANFNNFLASDFYGRESEIFLYFLIIGFAPFTVLKTKTWKARVFWASVSFFFFFLDARFDHIVFPANPEVEAMAPGIALSSRLGTFIASIISISYQTYSNDRLLNDLQHSRKRLDKAQEIARIGTFETNVKQGTVQWSDALYRIYGRENKNKGRPKEISFDHIHPEDRDALIQEYKRMQHLDGPLELEYRSVKGDGTVVFIRSFMEFERDSKGHLLYVIGASQDITREKERETLIRDQEAKIIASSKLSSLGEMAGSIAHEISNPLAIIGSRAEQLRRALENNKYDQERFLVGVRGIQTTVERIAKIIRGLRSFSRNSEKDPMAAFGIVQILNDTLELCREKLKHHGVEIRIDAPEDLQIICRPSQVSQILMNLISNSHDAVEALAEKWIEIRIANHEGQARVTVTDSGSGIDPAIVAKIMQPFFTTKELGKGTGLGLSISVGLASEHGGRLYYDNGSKNTRFVLDLPLAAHS